MQTLDIPCVGYSVKTDIYNDGGAGPVVLSLIGRTSYRKRKRYAELGEKLANQLDATTIVFDYSGHGDSPFNIEDISPAQHLLEVVAVFDWAAQKYAGRKIVVIGSSYGGFMALHLMNYRKFDGLLLRAPAIYEEDMFYTPQKNQNRAANRSLRRNAEALTRHPLFKTAKNFKGKVLLIIHENDEVIPKETTDAYANAFRSEIYVARGFPHSLSDVTDVEGTPYNQKIAGWMVKNFSKPQS